MKKTVARLLACILLALCLGGCGRNEALPADQQQNPEGKIRLEVLWWGNQVRNIRTYSVLRLYAQEHPGVEFGTSYTEWEDYWTRLAACAAGRVMPDILQMDQTHLQQYVEKDLLVDLRPYMESGLLDFSNVDESIIRSGEVGEGIYALCGGINVPTLLYNKTLLDEAGITVRDNMNIDEFMALSREVYEKTGRKTNIAVGTSSYLEYFCRAYDGGLFREDSLSVSRGTLERYYGMFEQGLAEGWLIDQEVFTGITAGSINQDPMVFGDDPAKTSWCSFFHSNQIAAVTEASPEGMEIGITTWPSDDSRRSNCLKPSLFFAISTDSKNPEEAAAVLNYLINSEECNKILMGERGLPVSAQVAEAISRKMSEPDKRMLTFINKVIRPNCSEVSPAAPAMAGDIYTLNDRLVKQVSCGTMTAAQAAEEMLAQGGALAK